MEAHAGGPQTITATSAPAPKERKLIFDADSKKFYEVVTGKMFERCVEVNDVQMPPVMKPYIGYFGPRITLEDCRQVLAFFAYTQKKSRSEAMVRWFANPTTGEIKPWAFPQWHGTGMTVKEMTFEEMDKTTQDQYQIERGQFGRGWEPVGTWHHHCNAPAFQSGTDHADELSQNGLHMTIGKLDEPMYDVHARVLFNKVHYQMQFIDWFDVPQIDWLPIKVIEEHLSKRYFKAVPESEFNAAGAFPERWKMNLVEKKYTGGYFGGGSFNSSHTNAGRGFASTRADNDLAKIVKLYELRKDVIKLLPIGVDRSKAIPDMMAKVMANPTCNESKEISQDIFCYNLMDSEAKLVLACIANNLSIAAMFRKTVSDRLNLLMNKPWSSWTSASKDRMGEGEGWHHCGFGG